MKKITCLALSLCIMLSLCIPFAASAEGANRTLPSGQYGVAVIEVNGHTLEVPSIKNVTGLSRSTEGEIASTQTIFVPMGTEESLTKNAQLVQEIKEYGAPVSRGYGDFYDDGYIWFHSTLNYTTSTVEGSVYYDLISFKLEREIYVESVYNNFNKASAHVMQIGAKYKGGWETITQETWYNSVSYGSLYSIPNEWIPVYNVGYFIGVEYSVFIDYNDSLGLQDYTLTYIHQAV